MDKLLYLIFTTLFISGDVFASKIGGRIVGGEPTTIEQFPHQVSVIYIDTHFCGGSIINENHVLTAAHCTNTYPTENLLIRAGSTYLEEGGQIISVARVFQHNQFDSETFDYDISILRLSNSLSFGSGVAAIQLPPQGNVVPGGIEGIATGWGRLYTNGPLPMELQKVVLPTLDESVCQMIYDDRFTGRMFCAGYVKGLKDTCQGDSGGPFVDGSVLLGITSWGDGCGDANSPGVYTKVTFFRDFIDSALNNAFQIDTRIVGGDSATIENYPYQVSVIYIDSHMCGGSLINPSYVLTAAHCTLDMEPRFLLVRAGSTYLEEGGQVRQVVKIYQHPNYDDNSHDSDIAVLQLNQIFDIGVSIQIIALPEQDDVVPDDTLGVITGWGRLTDNGAIPFELQSLQVPVINRDACNLLYQGEFTDNMFCAGYIEGGKDSCQGDSGGPLMVQSRLVGITSWGNGCAQPNSPGVYTNVASFRNFIDSILTVE